MYGVRAGDVSKGLISPTFAPFPHCHRASFTVDAGGDGGWCLLASDMGRLKNACVTSVSFNYGILIEKRNQLSMVHLIRSRYLGINGHLHDLLPRRPSEAMLSHPSSNQSVNCSGDDIEKVL